MDRTGDTHRPHRTVRRLVALIAGTVAATSLAWTGLPAAPAHALPQVSLVKVAYFKGSIDTAVNPATGATYVATRRGMVYMLRPGKSARVAIDMRWRVRMKGEQGLLGIAFHPTLPYVYVTYNSISGGSLRLVEYTVRTNGTFTRSRTVLIQKKPDSNHNGGNIEFGPDGYLYWGFGDGGGGGDPKRNALNPATLLGKMIRIDPRPANGTPYSVPDDNPFVGVDGVRPEIWSSGWRNPWRWSFDSATGDLWIADVGQGRLEEVNLARAADGLGKGLSYGWSAYEGTERYNEDQPEAGHEDPLYEYTHAATGGCAVTGGIVYRGTAMPDLQGAYVFADFCVGKLWALTLDGDDNPTVSEIGTAPAPVSFGTAPDGELFVVSLGGTVYRIVPSA